MLNIAPIVFIIILQLWMQASVWLRYVHYLFISLSFENILNIGFLAPPSPSNIRPEATPIQPILAFRPHQFNQYLHLGHTHLTNVSTLVPPCMSVKHIWPFKWNLKLHYQWESNLWPHECKAHTLPMSYKHSLTITDLELCIITFCWLFSP